MPCPRAQGQNKRADPRSLHSLVRLPHPAPGEAGGGWGERAGLEASVPRLRGGHRQGMGQRSAGKPALDGAAPGAGGLLQPGSPQQPLHRPDSRDAGCRPCSQILVLDSHPRQPGPRCPTHSSQAQDVLQSLATLLTRSTSPEDSGYFQNPIYPHGRERRSSEALLELAWSPARRAGQQGAGPQPRPSGLF